MLQDTSPEMDEGLSRRALLKTGGAAGGLAVLAAMLGGTPAWAEAPAAGGILAEPAAVTPMKQIFLIAEGAEQLAITLYRNGVANAKKLGLTGDELNYLKAAGIEEQIHHDLFASITGVAEVAPNNFSFPHGAATFEELDLFIAAQQQLEAVFDSAFLAGVREFSRQGAHRAAQISAQIACIEAEHRVLGVQIAAAHGIKTLPNGYGPLPTTDTVAGDHAATISTAIPNNLAYAPVLVSSVPEAVVLATKAGYATPKPGNSYQYEPIDLTSSTYSAIAAQVVFKQPYIQLTATDGTQALAPAGGAATGAGGSSAIQDKALVATGTALLAGAGAAMIAHHRKTDEQRD